MDFRDRETRRVRFDKADHGIQYADELDRRVVTIRLPYQRAFHTETNPLKRVDLDDFVACFHAENRHVRKETERFKSCLAKNY